MEIEGHEETTGEEIDWACDTRDELEASNFKRKTPQKRGPKPKEKKDGR